MEQALRFREHHLVLCLLVAAGLLHLSPLPAVMTPIGAMGLFTGAYLRRAWMWLVPLLALLLVDWLDGRGLDLTTGVSYLAFPGAALLGRWFLNDNDSNRRIFAALPAAVLACWLTATAALMLAAPPASFTALWLELAAALPTLTWHLVSDGLYALLLFGGYKLLREAPFVYYSPEL